MDRDQEDTLAIAFPDEGAQKRFHQAFTEWPTITCFKIREGDKRIVKVKEGTGSMNFKNISFNKSRSTASARLSAYAH